MKEILEKVDKLKNLLANKSDGDIVDLVKSELNKATKQPEAYFKKYSDQSIEEISDNLYILSKALNVPPTNLKYYNDVYKVYLSKAVTTSGAGLGAEWIPSELSPKILELMEEKYEVANQFQEFDMPTNPYKLPVNLEQLIAYYRAEDVTTALTDISSGKTITEDVVLTAKKFVAYIPISDEATEDMLVSALPAIKEAIARSLARAVDTAIINGDDSTSHMDSDVTSSSDPRKAFKGLRKYALSASLTVDASGITSDVAPIRKMRIKMGKYGINPKDLVLITSPAGYVQLLNLPEVATMEQIGSDAVIKTGALTMIDGIPIIVSSFVRQDLNTNGVYESSADKTIFILVNKNAFVRGKRGGVVTERDRNILYQREDFVSARRVAFAPLVTPSSTYSTVVLGLGVPTTI